MERPIFFSVGGEADTRFAEKVKQLLPDRMVYFYKSTGDENVNFQKEIEAAIQGCQLFVAFWSGNYLKSEHASRELAFFRRLVEGGQSDKDLLVVPTERTHPNLQGRWKNPITNA